jgi:hypothetical protein
VTGRRVVFVLDLSGAMRDPIGKGKATRWEVAREELAQTLAGLADGLAVNVVLFQEDVESAFDAPRPLDAKTRKALRTFLRRTSPGERGNLLAGVLHAVRQDADSVYLLSDGAPSTGEMVHKGRVRATIRQENRRLKRAIHCVGFGAQKSSERSFLARIAAESGGEVVYR